MKCSGVHTNPVHFNRGKWGNIWLCVACNTQMSGPRLQRKELKALIAFVYHIRKDLLKARKSITAPTGAGEKYMQLSFNFEDGATVATIAAKLRWHAGLLEGQSPKTAASRKNTDATVDEEHVEEVDEDDDIEVSAPAKTVKKTATKKAAAVEIDDDAEEDDEEDFDEPVAKKTAKKKALESSDVIAVCKRISTELGEGGFRQIKALLKKKFKSESVSSIKPDLYPAVVAAVEALVE